jgi:hypothetical protein
LGFGGAKRWRVGAGPADVFHPNKSELDAHPWGFHGWGTMPMGSGDFADLKLCFPGLIDQNRIAFPYL